MRSLPSLVLAAAVALAVLVAAPGASAAKARSCGTFATTSAFAEFSACPPETISGNISATAARDGTTWSGTVTYTLREKDPVTGFADSTPNYALTDANLNWTVNSSGGGCTSSGDGQLGIAQLDGSLVMDERELPSGFTAPPGAGAFHYNATVDLKRSATLPTYTVTCPPPPDGSGTRQEPISSRDSIGTAVLYVSLTVGNPVTNILTDLNTFTGTLGGAAYVATWTWDLKGGVKPATKISERGVTFIEREEGYRGKAYNDELGYCTIGYGTLLTPKHQCNAKDRKLKLTKAQAEDRLRTDLEKRFEPPVRARNLQLTQCQYDALVSFAYNVSVDSWKSLSKKWLTQSKLPKVSVQLLRYNKGKDTKTGKFRVVKAVDQRRKREAAMFDRCPCDSTLPAMKAPYYK